MSALPQTPAALPVLTSSRSPLLTVAEVADYLRVSEMTVYRLIKGQELAAARIGRRYRVAREDLLSFVDHARSAPGNSAG